MPKTMSGPDRSRGGPARRALLLDFDGTIADTLPVLRDTYADFLRRIDATQQAPTFAQANGANLFQLITELCRQHVPDQDAAALWQQYWHSIETAVLQAAPMDGTHEIVAWARSRGWLIGIGSASRTGLIADWLERHALRTQIDCIIGADLCDRGKPDPVIYHMLVDQLAVAPRDCVVIEDSDSGVTSANRAGLAVIRLTGTHPLADSQATASYDAVDLSAALGYLQQRFSSPRQA
jgi:HAD superfamily hydrolase (TIGR01509 family)